MKRFLTLTLVLLAFGTQAQTDTIPKPDSIYYMPETDAIFPGGIEGLLAYIENNLRLPDSDRSIEGKVFVRFIVGKDGTVSDPFVQIGIPGCKKCDDEALRLVREMPRWTPATEKGVAVNSYFHLPIKFSIKR